MPLFFLRAAALFAFSGLFSLLVLWCPPLHAQPAPGATQTVTDLAGRSVKLPAKVERILLGEGRLLPALAVFERDDPARRLVGMMGDYESPDEAGYAQWRSRFPQIDKVPRVGRNSSGSFSDEQAIALRPQVAILGLAGGHGPSKNDRETLARLEAAGVAVVFIDFRHDPLKNTPRSMELLGTVLGKRKEADECCATMVGLVGLLMDAGGANNVARGLIPGEHGTLNPEFLIATQPQLYIGTGIGSMATAQKSPLRIVLGADATPEAARASLVRATQRRGIAQLQAVQQPGRAHAIWHHYYNSPFNVVAVQVFAKWQHPELFADLDPRETLQTMFTRFQPIPLTGVYWTSL